MEGINEKEESEQGPGPGSVELGRWTEIQDTLKKRVITVDDFPWRLPSPPSESQQQQLKYVGGVDVSFSKEDPSMACGSLVVLDLLHDLRLVYREFTCVRLDIPYVPGFLAFREAPILVNLLEKMKKEANPFYPQVLMVDGNGLLHPRGFGLASHLGVIADIPTIGIGKNLHHVDGLTRSGLRKLLEDEENRSSGIITLRGNSGFIWGAAMRSNQGSLKPVFVSIGHRVSLETAIKIVNMTCKFRVPEPIRQADIRSREHLRELKLKCPSDAIDKWHCDRSVHSALMANNHRAPSLLTCSVYHNLTTECPSPWRLRLCITRVHTSSEVWSIACMLARNAREVHFM
ncbi:hypothetical protein HRI_001826300 [Hibiscus trionum]|uniref:Endonuclease V n=1 Tax=Hibiscus trionum TaxID=183268 RepID=A0A9W7HP89_HIBTR|nr:hypothetical protein HRI_001826300 [Hibiscus trionum]